MDEGLYEQHSTDSMGQHQHKWTVSAVQPVQFYVEETPGLFDIRNRTLLERFVDPSRPLRRFFVVDENVWKIYGEKIQHYLDHHKVEHKILVMPVDETDKTIENVLKIVEELCTFGLLRRHEPVIAVGGGVLLDMVGMAASLYRRGVPYIRVPTTLLGLVDASVGAKTGCNYVHSTMGELKNRMGTYWPPLAAFLDKTFLPTVDSRNMRNGICEMLKMAMVRSPELFELLEKYGPELVRNKFQTPEGSKAIALSVELMLQELQPNLWEMDLDRLVDFGHSFSKVMEMKALPELLHGEAVNIDDAISTTIAYLRGWITSEERERIFRCMHSLGLPYDHPLVKQDILFEGIKDSLEHRDGKMRLPLPTGIGKADFCNDVTYEELALVAAEHRRFCKELQQRISIEEGVAKSPRGPRPAPLRRSVSPRRDAVPVPVPVAIPKLRRSNSRDSLAGAVFASLDNNGPQSNVFHARPE
eukprot:tig00000880_g5180.t1